MADDEQREQELVLPEADERCGWRVRHPVGCAGVSLVCIDCQAVHGDLLLTFLMLLLGLLGLFLYGLACDYIAHRAMAAAVLPPEVEVELVPPEADERSRWAVTCLMGCAGVSIIILRFHWIVLHDNDPRMRLLVFLLACLSLFLCGICEVFLFDMYFTPAGHQRLVDKFLLL